jgi:hypothetical protein
MGPMGSYKKKMLDPPSLTQYSSATSYYPLYPSTVQKISHRPSSDMSLRFFFISHFLCTVCTCTSASVYAVVVSYRISIYLSICLSIYLYCTCTCPRLFNPMKWTTPFLHSHAHAHAHANRHAHSCIPVGSILPVVFVIHCSHPPGTP